ncbi:MMPL family transporter [Nocardioides marmoribigeumensis]|uniref:RND superfamily putative drug exporter n=1 Tax=Nocardioides marmoribigeumensis TaxID=433649 RepID=A0ABU2C1P7_9ACTN|nr:MMPL family transporter [Nocardioides marmoribigeumensis]MDR7364596.1 RND superfamily putative drug exporter [Nocardioides marmoribigeumensis]
MSSFLFRLGRAVSRRARRVVALWLLVLVGVGAVAGLLGGQLRDDLSIPGTESQAGLDVLDTRFPELTGTLGQVVFGAPRGGRISDYRAVVDRRIKAIEDVDHVRFASHPFEKGQRALSISEDGRYALVQVQLDLPLEKVTPQVRDDIGEAARGSASSASSAAPTVHLGGQMFTTTSTPVSVTEAVGLVVALVVLLMTLGSFVAAGIPLLTAVLGVGITMSGVLVLARFFAINSSTPSLAIMIGLAVGIDYALFIAARHRAQLAEGMEVEESVARSVATAGSAVIFAGATVIVALCGLVVARIPFLTVMGFAGATAVAVAVLIAVTLVPAALALGGERLRPRKPTAAAGPRRRRTLGDRWVGLVTARPALTVGVALAGLVLLALPAKDLALGLPDVGSHEKGSTERTTYDLISREYGAGFNGPLLVVVDIIRTTDPVGVMRKIGDDVEKVPGVDAVALTTPNRKADLGIVQVIPEHGQTDPRTSQLVRDLRAAGPGIEKKYDVSDLMVTGQTAVTIDVSDRLAGALLPFGLVVVGFSLLLLMLVFRSVWVPVKATLGYLFSVAASFGAVVLVFQEGHLAELLNVEKEGPVLSFLPIILMGVLFGLAMDYEVFLVSRMREDWVHHRDAAGAIRRGFTSSARVVTAAAVIMVAVFASFVPEGDASVKPMAFGLAVGVLVDAFVVRMTLVPAVLALLGERAWWLPTWLEQRLPRLDIEGEGLTAHLEHEEWTASHGPATVRAEGLRVVDPTTGASLVPGLSLTLAPGQVVVLTGSVAQRRAALSVVSGRLRPSSGRVVVLDRMVPEESAWVRSRVAVDTTVPSRDPREPLVLLDLANGGIGRSADDVRRLAESGVAVLVACPAESLDDPVLERLGAPAVVPLSGSDREEVLA